MIQKLVLNKMRVTFTAFFVIISMALSAINANVVVNTFDSQGNPISAKYKVFKGPNYIGEFNAGTAASLVVGQSYKIFAHYKNTSTDRVTFTVDPNGNTFNYSTTNVTFHWTGGYLDYRGSGSWKSFGKTNGVWNSIEIFPNDFNGNTMKFHIGYKWNDPRSMTFEMDFSGQSTVEKVLSQLLLLDHSGNPLSGGKARGGYASPTSWFVAGETSADGLLLEIRNGSNDNLSYEMKYNKTTSQSAQQTSSIYEFQTDLITMRLEKCDGTPIDGGHVRWGNGANYGTSHFVGGNTGASSPGETSAEFFPGTYSFEMGLSGTVERKISYNFPTDGATLVWKTTNVTLNHTGSISFGGPTGDSRWFNKPSMELMPGGTYKFHFRGAGRIDITIPAPCGATPFVQSGIVLRLEDSNGNGLDGAIGKYYSGGWQTAGTTNTDGNILILLPGTPGNTKFRIEKDGLKNEKYQNVGTNPLVVFATKLVTFDLQSSIGNSIAGATTKYYGSGWKTFGSGTTYATMELLPANIKFRVEHAGLKNEKYQNTNSNSDVVFNTTLVTFDLQSSTSTSIAGATTKYYGSGWKTFGSGTTYTTMELLPANIKFRVEHGGLKNEKYQNTGSDPNVVFNTVLVTFTLNNSSGNPLANGTTSYYGSGWKTFGNGTTTTSMELLPANTKFRVKHQGIKNEKYQNTGLDANVLFATRAVKMIIWTGDPVPAGNYKFMHYGSGWKTHYDGFAPGGSGFNGYYLYVQLLPGNIKYKGVAPCGTDQFYTTADIVDLNPCGLVWKDNNGIDKPITGNAVVNVNIYPNPATTVINVESNEDVFIYSTTGLQMYAGKAKRIDVSDWASGIYFVRSGETVKKFIVK